MKKFTTWKIWGLWLCCMMLSSALAARTFDVTPDSYDTVSLCRSELPLMYDTVRIDDAGDYLINITSSMDTDSIVSLHVIVFENPVVVIDGDMSHCVNGRSIVYVDDSYASYQWSTGGVDYYTMTSDSSCSVLVTDANGCKGTDTVYFEILPLPVVELSGNMSVCYQDTTVLRVTGAMHYYWSKNSVNISHADSLVYVAEDGNGYIDTIRLRAYSSLGCVKQTEVYIEVYPKYQGVDTVIVCRNDLPYQRLDSLYDEEGTYPVHYQSQQGCDSLIMMTLMIKENPEVHIIGADSLCADQLSAVTASGADSYVWSTQSTSLSIVVQPGRSYWLKGTAANGCSTTDSITVRSLQVPVVSIEGPTEACYGDNVVLTATEGYSYHWSDGSSNSTLPIYATESDTYQVTAVNVHDCYATATASLTVYPVYDTSISVICCTNDLPYLYHGHSFTQNGTYEVHLSTVHGCDSVVHLTLTILESPYAIISGITDICPGSSTSLSANGNGTFRWSTGATRSPITVNTPGWYVLTVTATNGCKAYDSVEVAHLPLPNVTISGSNSVCRGSELLLMASGAYSYNWNTGVMGPVLSVTPTQTTSYVVTGTSDRGCTATATHTVTVKAVPVANIAGPDAICQGGTAVFTASGGAQYAWSHGPTTASVQLTSEQLYTVEVTNQAGCTSTASKYLTVNSVPTVSILGQDYFCEGGSTILNASGIGAVSYVWNNISIGQSYIVNRPGIYTVVATSSANCSASASVSVTQHPNPVIVVSGNTAFCEGESAQLTASGGQSYVWRNNYGALVANTSTVTLSEGGSYTVIATDEYACSSTQPVNVVKNNLPVVSIVASSSELCKGETATLTANNGVSFNWSTGATSQSITVSPSQNTNYSVTITDQNSCSASASLPVVVHENVQLHISGSDHFCAGDSVVLIASGSNQLVWSTGQTGNRLVVYESGDYSVSVSNTDVCVSTATQHVDQYLLPTLSISGPSSICQGNSANLTALANESVTYVWNTGATTDNISVNSTGEYSVIVTNNHACSTQASKTVTVHEVPNVTINAPASACSGTAVSLNAIGNASQYNWSTGASGSSITIYPSSTETYQVTAVNEYECSSVASATVMINPSYDTTIRVSCCSSELPYIYNGQSYYQSGTYELHLTTMKGCDSTIHFVLTVNENPYAIISGNTEVCSGETTQLSANGNGTIRWNTGYTRSPITVSTPGWYVLTVTAANGCQAFDSVEVVHLPLPDVAVTGVNSVCRGTEVMLTAIGANSYSWNTGVTGPVLTITPLQTNSYIVTGTSDHGCTATASHSLTVNPTPTASISGPDAICQGETAVFTAAGGTSYLWSTGATTASVQLTNAQQYTVEVSNQYGCTATASKSLEVNVLPTVSIVGQDYFCEGGSTTLSAVGTGVLSYLWNNSAVGQSYVVSTPGVYTVLATSPANCTATASVTVSQQSVPVVSVSGDLSFCDGQSTTLTAMGGQNYSWRNAYGAQIANTASLTLSEGGAYSVVVSDTYGCSASQQLIVTKKNLPNVTIVASDNEVCEGTPVTLNAGWVSGYSYQWSTGSTERQIVINSAGTYSLQVSANGCTAIDSTTITMHPLPDIVFSGDLAICKGNMATVYATAPNASSFLWNTGSTVNNISVLPMVNTNYWVTAEDVFGCVNQDTVLVRVEDLPTPTIAGPDTICVGGSATLVASGGMSYLWDDGSTDAERLVNAAGDYAVTVFTSAGCSATTQKSVYYYAMPTVHISGDSLMCVGDSVVLTVHGALTYLWSDMSSDTSLTVSAPGVYTVEGWDANGCSARDSMEVSERPLPAVQIVGNPVGCAGSMNLLTAQAPTAVSYLWNTGSTAAQIQVNATDVYSVEVRDVNACKASASFSFQATPAPSCEILGRTNICMGDTTTLTASNGVYFFWSNGAVSQSITVSPSSTTNYSLVIMDENGCSANTSAQVVVHANVPIVITGNSDFCDGDSVLLVANTNQELLWSDGQYGDSIYVHETGDYSVHAVDSSTCLLPSTFHVEKHQAPELQLVGADYLCMGDTGILSAQTNETVTYQWTTGATESSIRVTSTNVYGVTVTNGYGCSNTASKLLMVYSAPTVSVNGPSTVCNGVETNLNATGSATHFSWSTGDSTASITVTPRYSTTYQVVGSNNFGCTASASLYVTVIPVPMVSITGDTTLCQGEVAVLTSSNASSYHWSTGSNNRSINVSTTGTYTVTVTNSTGCTNSASIYVHVYDLPNLMILGDTMLCRGEQTELLAIGATNYLWSNGSTNPSIVVAPENSTSYSVQAFNGVCMAELSRQVIVNDKPTAVISAPDGICDGSVALLTAQGGMAYLWSTGQSSAMIELHSSGNYQLIAFNQYGCSDTTNHNLIQYPNPQVQISGPSAICQDAEAVLTAVGNGSLLWNNGDTTTSITINSSGNYSVQVTDYNGCSASTNHFVSTLSSPVIVIAGPDDMCDGETVSLTAVCANAASFSWNTGVSSNTIQVNPASTTTYSVTAVSADGCVAQESHTLAVHPSYSADFTAEICQGQPYSGYGFNLPVQNVPGEFVFTDNLQTAYGCDSIRSLHLTVKPIPVITGNIIGNSEVTSLGNFVYMIDPVENANLYEWIISNPNWSVSYNQTVAQVSVLTPGTATLSVYALNECGQSQPVSIQISYGMGINDAEMSVIRVYPNPTNGMINVQCTMNNAQLFNGELQLFDMYGKMLNRWEMSGENMELDLSPYAAGVYLLKLRNTQTATESVVKVVKQ